MGLQAAEPHPFFCSLQVWPGLLSCRNQGTIPILSHLQKEMRVNGNPARQASGKIGVTFLLLALLGSLGARGQANPEELRLLDRIPLPPAQSVATDIRWAGDSSVYISWDRDGVAEIGLDGVRRRGLVPNLKTLGDIDHYTHLAISPSTLVIASQLWETVWRPLQGNPGGEVTFQRHEIPIVEDIDVAGDRILLLGLAKHEHGARDIAPDGAVAWVGTLSGKMEDFKPVLYDLGGPGAPNYFHCRDSPMGAVRFLADGSFIVAPGFQNGIHLFKAGGKRVRSWTNEQVGIDTHPDCPNMSEEADKQFRMEAGRIRWFNGHHILDDILPLPQGPGLLVRSWGKDGQVHWTLKVLQAGGIKTYAVPITGRLPVDRLHGDVRNGRIVLLRSSGFSWSWDPVQMPAEIFLLELPTIVKEGPRP
jgi:hypothetical protein